ncbi:MAG TPA: flagellar export chaperone FliS [Campylobacterales bacterium]|nr:flagellar export chaperone FliS [Campylobacterales bacterium]HIO70677.1 flagellar export chaperone FliS [Campylobacterales bacterium]
MTTEELLKQQQATDEENNSAVQAYKRNNLHIESKIKLVEALYEGILRFNSNLIKAIEENDVEAKVEWANKSSSIFIELMNALDMDSEGTIAQYLQGLYSQQLQYLFEANRDNDIEKVELVNKVVRGLLEAWREVAFEQK